MSKPIEFKVVALWPANSGSCVVAFPVTLEDTNYTVGAEFSWIVPGWYVTDKTTSSCTVNVGWYPSNDSNVPVYIYWDSDTFEAEAPS